MTKFRYQPIRIKDRIENGITAIDSELLYNPVSFHHVSIPSVVYYPS